MSTSKPSLIVHIGQQKTGSKALQSFLALNRKALRRRGLFYPISGKPESTISAYAQSHFSLFAMLRREALAAIVGEAESQEYWLEQSNHCRPFAKASAFFEEIEKERRRAGISAILLSAEDIFDMQTAHNLDFSLDLVEAGARRLSELATAFGYQVRIVVYLRRQDHLLGAHYVQFIKGGRPHDIDMDSFARLFAPRLCFRDILKCWEGAFGWEKIVVRLYERGEHCSRSLTTSATGLSHSTRIVPDFFQHALGMPVPDDCATPAEDIESVNPSPGRDFIEFLRILNRRSGSGLPVFPREKVLDMAYEAGPTQLGPTGIGAWLSPKQRRELLACHDSGNDAIARDFLHREPPLFTEPLPQDEDWQPYAGLSAEKAVHFALAIQKKMFAEAPASHLGRLAHWWSRCRRLAG